MCDWLKDELAELVEADSGQHKAHNLHSRVHSFHPDSLSVLIVGNKKALWFRLGKTEAEQFELYSNNQATSQHRVHQSAQTKYKKNSKEA